MPVNPYESPTQSGVESSDKRLPLSAHLMAAVSFVFVMVGFLFIACVFVVFLQEPLDALPGWVSAVMFCGLFLSAPTLGLLSAWQSIRRAKRKLRR